MKTPLSFPRRATNPRAFSLTELLVVVAVFSLLILATVSSQIFGLKLYRLSETKMTTTADARSTLNRIRDEIRSGRLLYVGNGDCYSFNLVADNAPHAGNALKICPTTDTNDFVYYYLDSDQCLNRMVSGSDAVQMVASHVTNQVVFRAEDFRGNVLTNYQNNRVIAMTLQFYRREFALARNRQGGPDGLYDYYQLQTRIARRTIE